VPNLKRIMISVPDNLLEEFDGLVDLEKKNRSEFIREAMKFYLAHRRRRVIYEQMKKGYQEMARINLAIARESFGAENEALSNCDNKFTEYRK
jgi:CopG family transcriptional regulator/antitoxin EndoAI